MRSFRALSSRLLGELGREDRPGIVWEDSAKMAIALEACRGSVLFPGVLVVQGKFARHGEHLGVFLPDHPVASVHDKCGQGRFAPKLTTTARRR